MEGLEDLLHASLIFDIGNNKLHALKLILIGVLQLELEVVHGTLGLVEHDDLLGLILHKLTTDLRADAASCTRNKHHLVDHLANDIDVVHLDGLTLQQVFNLDILNLVNRERAIKPSRDMGHSLDSHTQIEGLGSDGLFVQRPNSGDSDYQLVNLLGLDKLGIEYRTDTHDGHTVKRLVDLRHIVIDKSHHTIVIVNILLEGVVGDDTCRTGTVNQHIDRRTAAAEVIIIDTLHGESRQYHHDSEKQIKYQRFPIRHQIL